ncbi:hypothetical protein V6B95_12730 [Thermoanaerobacterium saccharolyticum]|uniref:Uncharacterized protein n=2 Tax=Thermoanaerobacterium TaxID=28895 RepID=W9E8U0_9THEO|nr:MULTISPECIES: hypothetical protein [Thermoanaerobacterium]AFK86156.1 hypothetical protein Tsac_1143 [Thermoanaerobacterium saccharolyticum JW/SL-YS485]ETO37255.1 hypothetical protein V518_2568 [Thermoanaerobacterium aotearoense SCUT27]
MKKIYGLILVFVVMLAVIGIVYADSTQDPGSQQDPIVTKSYVDSKYDDLKNYIDSKVGAVSSSNYDIVELKPGESITLYQGSEAIVRTDNTSTIVTSTDGVSDLTGGKDLKNNALIPANHLLLFPRSDGRGIKAKADTIIVVMGKYTKN